jgi:hypothetical protein
MEPSRSVVKIKLSDGAQPVRGHIARALDQLPSTQKMGVLWQRPDAHIGDFGLARQGFGPLP